MGGWCVTLMVVLVGFIPSPASLAKFGTRVHQSRRKEPKSRLKGQTPCPISQAPALHHPQKPSEAPGAGGAVGVQLRVLLKWDGEEKK